MTDDDTWKLSPDKPEWAHEWIQAYAERERFKQKVATVAAHTPWPLESVERLLSRFPRLTIEQATAAIRAAEAHSKAEGDDFAWVYAFQLAAFVSD